MASVQCAWCKFSYQKSMRSAGSFLTTCTLYVQVAHAYLMFFAVISLSTRWQSCLGDVDSKDSQKLHKQNRLECMQATATMEAYIDERLSEEARKNPHLHTKIFTWVVWKTAHALNACVRIQVKYTLQRKFSHNIGIIYILNHEGSNSYQ